MPWRLEHNHFRSALAHSAEDGQLPLSTWREGFTDTISIKRRRLWRVCARRHGPRTPRAKAFHLGFYRAFGVFQTASQIFTKQPKRPMNTTAQTQAGSRALAGATVPAARNAVGRHDDGKSQQRGTLLHLPRAIQTWRAPGMRDHCPWGEFWLCGTFTPTAVPCNSQATGASPRRIRAGLPYRGLCRCHRLTTTSDVKSRAVPVHRYPGPQRLI